VVIVGNQNPSFVRRFFQDNRIRNAFKRSGVARLQVNGGFPAQQAVNHFPVS
jgi:hypothetical protein